MTRETSPGLHDRFAGLLLGTAIGDALGLPMEGMRGTAITRRYPQIDRYRLLGSRGFVSDDTEQSALLAQCLVRHPRDLDCAVRAFRRSLLGWFVRLPWGLGFGTLKACLRIAMGFRRSGVRSAGNGAAMRAAIIGAFFSEAPRLRADWGDALSQVTHTDPRAVEGARFIAEVAAKCTQASTAEGRDPLVAASLATISEPSILHAVGRARELARNEATIEQAGKELGCTGFIVHTVGIATFCFVKFGDDPIRAVATAIRAGGDTDSNAAIVGAWVGALHGERGLPRGLIGELHNSDWFASEARPTLAGPTHLRTLAAALVDARVGREGRVTFSWVGALLRNLALYPVVLFHAFRVALSR